MNSVSADSTADHHDQIIRSRSLAFAGRPIDLGGKSADGATEDQGFAEVAMIEDFPAPTVGDAALITAIDDSLVYSISYSSGVQEAARHWPTVERWMMPGAVSAKKMSPSSGSITTARGR